METALVATLFAAVLRVWPTAAWHVAEWTLVAALFAAVLCVGWRLERKIDKMYADYKADLRAMVDDFDHRARGVQPQNPTRP